jgi:hypothetical protein
MLQTSAYPFVEVDHLAPIDARVDIADRAANRAAQVGVDVPPIPVRQILQRYLPATSAQLALGWPDAIDEHGLEAGAAIDGAPPSIQAKLQVCGATAWRIKAPTILAVQITPWVGPRTDPHRFRSRLCKRRTANRCAKAARESQRFRS